MFTKPLIIFSILLSNQFASAAAETFTSNSYSEIQKVLSEQTNAFSPSELLIVFDLDRTVLHSVDCLGEEDKTKGFFRFEKTVQLCDATITSTSLPKIIKNLQEKEYGVIALTARRAVGIDVLTPQGEPKIKYPMLEGTLKQLENLRVSEETEATSPIFFKTAPLYSNRVKTIKFAQQGRDKVLKKELVVKKGVAMASGANKGLALQAFVKRMRKANRPEQIVFIDDDKRNINHLEKAYADSKDSILIIHYTEFEKEKK